MISLKGLSKSFGAARILNGIDLDVPVPVPSFTGIRAFDAWPINVGWLGRGSSSRPEPRGPFRGRRAPSRARK